MVIRAAVAVLVLGIVGLAESLPPSCPADRPVDDIIAEIHRQQSKKANRNTNPLPSGICIAGWCRGRASTPPTVPEPAPRAQEPAAGGDSSSSKSPAEKCDQAMEVALNAAHNVDVGDYYFGEKNYRAALFRYQDAASEKPDDAAICVRLGRVFEKLNQAAQAIEQYDKAQRLAGPGKWQDEAKAALSRLQSHSGS